MGPDCRKREARRLTVLLIDDDDALIASLTRTIRARLGWEVLSASSPEAAATLYDRVDLVMTDWSMPDGGGARVLAECGKPVVVYSGCGEVGHPFHLYKPAPFDDIHALLLKALAGAR